MVSEIDRNHQLNNTENDKVESMKLAWGNTEHTNNILSKYPEGFDILFGSDIV